MIYRSGQPHKDHRDPVGTKHPYGDEDLRLFYESRFGQRGGVTVAVAAKRVTKK